MMYRVDTWCVSIHAPALCTQEDLWADSGHSHRAAGQVDAKCTVWRMLGTFCSSDLTACTAT